MGRLPGVGSSPATHSGATAGISSLAAVPTYADALRTKILGKNQPTAPAIGPIVTVMDAPWGVKGDAQRVSDGAITATQNILLSATATFAIGQSVEVVGAGAAGANLFGTVTAVAAGQATLSVSASTTVSGAIVTFGTNDTANFNTAHAAVSSLAALSPNGRATLKVPAGRSYMLGKITMKSNVSIDASGATIYFINAGTLNCGFQATHTTADAAVTNWSLHGATIVGDGAYITGNKEAVYCDVAGSSDIRVEDCQFLNLGDGAIALYAARCWVNRNYLNGIVLAGSRNAINIEANSALLGSASDVQIDGNILTDIGAHAIHFGSAGGASQTDWDLRISISNNKVYGSSGPAIVCEIGDSGSGFGFAHGTISGNIVDTTAIASGAAGIALGVSSNLESTNERFTVTGNVITIAGVTVDGVAGITIGGNDIAATGNVINVLGSTKISTHGISVIDFSQPVTATLDGSTAVVTGVVVGAGGATPVNGDFLTGTGITAGTYIVSGAETSTWTLSQATTIPGSGVTLNVLISNKRLMIANNIIHMAAAPSGQGPGNGINALALAHSQVINNIIYFDPGSTSNATYCISASNAYNSSFVNNRLTNSPRFGVLVTQLHDCDFTLNKVHNANQNSTAAAYLSCTGSTNLDFDFNRIIDDQPVSKMTTGILVGTSTGCRARGNRIIGATNASPISAIADFVEVAGNVLSAGTIAGTVTETYPGTTAFFTNTHPYPIKLFIAGGTITQISILTKNSSGSALITGQTQGVFDLAPGDQIKCTSSVNPSTFSSAPA